MNPQTCTEDAALNQLQSLRDVPLHLKTKTASVLIFTPQWLMIHTKNGKGIHINICYSFCNIEKYDAT